MKKRLIFLNRLRGGPTFDPVNYVKEVSHVRILYAESALPTQNANLFTREATSALGKVSEWQLDFSSRWKKLERYFRCTLTG